MVLGFMVGQVVMVVHHLLVSTVRRLVMRLQDLVLVLKELTLVILEVLVFMDMQVKMKVLARRL